MIEKNRNINFYISIILIVIITVTTFSTVRRKEVLESKKYIFKDTFSSEDS